MTPDELRTAADDLDRLEEFEPRPGRIWLSNRLRRHAAMFESGRVQLVRSDFGVAALEEQK